MTDSRVRSCLAVPQRVPSRSDPATSRPDSLQKYIDSKELISMHDIAIYRHSRRRTRNGLIETGTPLAHIDGRGRHKNTNQPEIRLTLNKGEAK